MYALIRRDFYLIDADTGTAPKVLCRGDRDILVALVKAKRKRDRRLGYSVVDEHRDGTYLHMRDLDSWRGHTWVYSVQREGA